ARERVGHRALGARRRRHDRARRRSRGRAHPRPRGLAVRALVTGGAGFLGATLVDRLLAEGHGVDVGDDLSARRPTNLSEARADRSAELRIHQVDIRSPEVVELIARRDPDVVFHLASLVGADPGADALANVVGAVHVLEGARLGGSGKVVFAAGAGLYG